MTAQPMPNATEVPFLDVRGAASVLGMSTDATYDAIARGDIPSVRVGRAIRVPVAALRRLANLDD